MRKVFDKLEKKLSKEHVTYIRLANRTIKDKKYKMVIVSVDDLEVNLSKIKQTVEDAMWENDIVIDGVFIEL